MPIQIWVPKSIKITSSSTYSNLVVAIDATTAANLSPSSSPSLTSATNATAATASAAKVGHDVEVAAKGTHLSPSSSSQNAKKDVAKKGKKGEEAPTGRKYYATRGAVLNSAAATLISLTPKPPNKRASEFDDDTKITKRSKINGGAAKSEAAAAKKPTSTATTISAPPPLLPPQRYLDMSSNPPEWKWTKKGEAIPDSSQRHRSMWLQKFDTLMEDRNTAKLNAMMKKAHDKKRKEHPNDANEKELSSKNKPEWSNVPEEEWEINILEKNKECPWWETLRSKRRRSTRLNKTTTPEKIKQTNHSGVQEGTNNHGGIPNKTASIDNSQRAEEAKLSRGERARRRQLQREKEAKIEDFLRGRNASENASSTEHQDATPKTASIKDVRASSQSNNDLHHDAKIDDFLRGRCANENESSAEQQNATPMTASIKDVHASAQCKKRNLSKSCTLTEDGHMTSGRVTLDLPPFPAKLGIRVEYNSIFGYPEIKYVIPNLSLASQIPLDFQKDCFITSIESDLSGRVTPTSVKHCGEIFDSARRHYVKRDGWKVEVNFAKNPMALAWLSLEEDSCGTAADSSSSSSTIVRYPSTAANHTLTTKRRHPSTTAPHRPSMTIPHPSSMATPYLLSNTTPHPH